ncbi:MAG TPA: hypothetical protein VKV24_07395 [Casimicrobiaceae bacterium]|nr:hypothetical protein [Casimicrobiaceae bacterium]
MRMSRNRLLFGTDEAVPDAQTLHAGSLDVIVRGPRLTRIGCGDVEIWHGVAFLFRDPDWGTPEPVVDAVDTGIAASSFRLRATGRFPVSAPIDFAIEIEGRENGHIAIAAQATPRADIRANRLGLCVLYPMSLGGERVEIEHVDGRVSRSTFPTLIPPWPPFMLVRAIRHEYAPGRWAHCRFEGDLFEVEDQRNNADASFKAYSRSNSMPRPYFLRGGVPVRQSVDLDIDAPRTMTRARRASTISVRIEADAGVLPSIGVEISAADAHANEATRAALAALAPAHLHLAVPPIGDAIDWHAIANLLALARAELRLDLVGASLEEAVERVELVGEQVKDAGMTPASVAAFPSEQRAIDAVRCVFPDSAVGGGTPHFFVQLNRLDNLGGCDFLSFTTSSIVHGADDESVMLTLQSLPSMIETLRRCYPNARVAVGPSGIAARASPFGTQPPNDGLHRIALARSDPRTRGLFGAAWTVGYVAQLATMHVDAITLMGLTGEAGIVGPDEQGAFARYPSHFVLERMRGPANVRRVAVSEPRRVAALALCGDNRHELLLANLGVEPIDVELEDAPQAGVAILDAGTWQAFASRATRWQSFLCPLRAGRVRLDAFAIASLQW